MCLVITLNITITARLQLAAMQKSDIRTCIIMRVTTRHIVFSLAVFAMLAQSLGTSLIRLSQLNNGQSAALICASSDKIISAQSLQAAKDLAHLLGKAAPKDASQIEHCADCIVKHFDLATQVRVFVNLRIFEPIVHQTALSHTVYAQSPRGPPLGGRAPPLLT